MPALTLEVVLLGKVGVGKSAAGNTILGRKGFTSKKSSKGVTLECVTETEVIEGINVVVYDTPGFCDPDRSDDDTEQRIQEGIFEKKLLSPRVFLLLVRIDRFTEEEKNAVISVERVLGEANLKQTWILFTRGDELDDDQTIDDYISESEDLKRVMSKYGPRYHVFNNKNGNQNQAKSLLEKIRPDYFGETKLQLFLTLTTLSHKNSNAERLRSTPNSNDASERRFILMGESGVGKSATGNTILGREYFRSDMSASSVTQNTQVGRTICTPISNNASEKRFILLGKSGVGKSAAGNTILGREYFRSNISASSVTQNTQAGRTNIDGRNICVVDTPGLFDTTLTPEALAKEIARSIYECTPGPHAFLIVIPINNRFTEQEKQIIEHYQKFFGPQMEKHAIVLFTHGDQLQGKTVEQLVNECSDLKKVLEQCGGRYQLFNNEDTRNRAQVKQLIQKVDSMLQSNGGSFYTSQMFEDAQKSGLQRFWDMVKSLFTWLVEKIKSWVRQVSQQSDTTPSGMLPQRLLLNNLPSC